MGKCGGYSKPFITLAMWITGGEDLRIFRNLHYALKGALILTERKCRTMTSVHVLSKTGKPLMPTIRFGRVRRLLKSGQAVIVKHEPFTIQLMYDTPEA
ncbi:MAG: RRXRR domain-containing protein, partial [Anaerolineaceae bacterium]|nr:RRXRR domain-containing protein [Anaerolineaceae bacterium]